MFLVSGVGRKLQNLEKANFAHAFCVKKPQVLIFARMQTIKILQNDIINEFNLNFVDVAKLYYKKHNKCLAFVPMYNAAKIKTLKIIQAFCLFFC